MRRRAGRIYEPSVSALTPWETVPSLTRRAQVSARLEGLGRRAACLLRRTSAIFCCLCKIDCAAHMALGDKEYWSSSWHCCCRSKEHSRTRTEVALIIVYSLYANRDYVRTYVLPFMFRDRRGRAL